MIRVALAHLCVVSISIWTVGCGGSEATKGVASTPDAGPTKAIEAYFGGGTVKGPKGEDYGQSITVAKRTIDPASNTIVEDVVNVNGNQPAKEYVVTWTIQGSTFTLSEQSGAFTGTGKFEGGEAWAWDAWSFDAVLAAHAGTTSAREWRSANGLDSEKVFKLPDGSVGAKISERVTSIPIDEFDWRRSDLLKP